MVKKKKKDTWKKIPQGRKAEEIDSKVSLFQLQWRKNSLVYCFPTACSGIDSESCSVMKNITKDQRQ